MMDAANNVDIKSDYDKRVIKTYDEVVEEFTAKMEMAHKNGQWVEQQL